MNKKFEDSFKVSKSFAQQSKGFCWKLDNLEATISFGSTLTRNFPNLKILFLQGPLGAGKTTLVKGIAKSLEINEPITSPTFPLAQHYPSGKPPLIHLDLYRLDYGEAANELFIQEEEEVKAIKGIMVVEWPERLSIDVQEAWKGTINYLEDKEGRTFQLIAPAYEASNRETSCKLG